ncbi:PREDICTED: uncharacterized protein LOC106818969 [Priapulus caudatus]|uniref:Uncharacterized protein LOC106818969 n=1 Tax=Priapulus caudatus TaxID=37621 RepID=A0ABM1F3U9_PRICU|nr:PREDICTED: uncharacterized protein LOC106818969 [Priapulus caudatus]
MPSISRIHKYEHYVYRAHFQGQRKEFDFHESEFAGVGAWPTDDDDDDDGGGSGGEVNRHYDDGYLSSAAAAATGACSKHVHHHHHHHHHNVNDADAHATCPVHGSSRHLEGASEDVDTRAHHACALHGAAATSSHAHAPYVGYELPPRQQQQQPPRSAHARLTVSLSDIEELAESSGVDGDDVGGRLARRQPRRIPTPDYSSCSSVERLYRRARDNVFSRSDALHRHNATCRHHRRHQSAGSMADLPESVDDAGFAHASLHSWSAPDVTLRGSSSSPQDRHARGRYDRGVVAGDDIHAPSGGFGERVVNMKGLYGVPRACAADQGRQNLRYNPLFEEAGPQQSYVYGVRSQPAYVAPLPAVAENTSQYNIQVYTINSNVYSVGAAGNKTNDGSATAPVNAGAVAVEIVPKHAQYGAGLLRKLSGEERRKRICYLGLAFAALVACLSVGIWMAVYFDRHSSS